MIRVRVGVLLLLCLVAFVESATHVSGPGTNICTEWYSYRQRFTTSCGFLWMSTCSKYRYASRQRYVCCSGWQTSNGVQCDLAVCAGKTNKNGACQKTISSGQLVKTDGSSVTASGGRCYKPGKCQNCAHGFYAKNGGPYCEVCPQLSNCDFEECGDGYRRCARCNGWYGSYGCHGQSGTDYGCSAFRTNYYKTACIEMCSWRYTSTSCWPGYCGSSGYKSSCSCHAWFSGHECLTLNKPPAVLSAGIKLNRNEGNGSKITVLQTDPNEMNKPNKIYWTKEKADEFLMKVVAEWKTTLPKKPKYINSDLSKTNIGINGAKVTYSSKRGSGAAKVTTHHLTCKAGSKQMNFPSVPEGHTPITCTATHPMSGTVLQHVYEHRASLHVEVSFTAGGFVTVINLDRGMSNRETRHIIASGSVTSTFKTTIKWDLVKPYCNGKNCLRLSTEKATKAGQSMTATWTQWQDDDSGIGANVQLSVSRLVKDGDELTDPCNGNVTATVPYSAGSWKFTVPTPGVYSVILTVSDAAGNIETARRFFVYDPSSKIQIKPGTVLTSSSAAASTSLDDQWQQNLDEPVEFVFSADRYINPDYDGTGFLGVIKACPDVEAKYDDTDGFRTRAAVRNNQGIIKKEAAYQSSPFIGAPVYSEIDLFATNVSYNISLEDGDTIKFFLRVTDFMDRTFTEVKLLMIDSSVAEFPADKLFFIRKLVKSSSSGVLPTLAFELVAYDNHSGLREVKWTVYENRASKDVVLHGSRTVERKKDLATCVKGNTKTLDHQCYCTISFGCFHKLILVNLEQKKARHDLDLYLDVTVTNGARLSTTQRMKKLVKDDTPPKSGRVHDGPIGVGNPDVDHQNSKTLEANWDSFSDKETGIAFYQYTWETSCQGKEVFGFDYDDTNVTQTTDTSAKWTAPSGGKYYITVVAFNAALVASDPVCSNGVTVEGSGPVKVGKGNAITLDVTFLLMLVITMYILFC